MIGSGGTFTALAHMSKFQREGRHGSVQGYVLTPSDIVHLLRHLRDSSLEARRQIPGLSPDRADIIVAGAAVISRLVRGLGTQEIMVNERGIRDGLLLRMICGAARPVRQSPAPQPSNRIEWARHFARKAHSNERHCEQVATLALQIFDGVKSRYDLPASSRDLLQAAAILHDVGYLISHAKHHKHAYHLIMHGELPGFSPHEVELIANVVRYHRKAFPRKRHENLAYLDGSDRRLIARLSGILRIAEGSGPHPFPVHNRDQGARPPGKASDQRRGPSRFLEIEVSRCGPQGGPLPQGVRHRRGAGLASAAGHAPGQQTDRAVHACTWSGQAETIMPKNLSEFPQENYLNRELSWLEFNGRVLEEAADPTNPVLERIKFLAIVSSNLDEFFEVRVAGLQEQLYAGLEPQDFPADGLAPVEQLTGSSSGPTGLSADQYQLLHQELMPAAAGERNRMGPAGRADPDGATPSSTVLQHQVYPVLTPLAIDPGHPFPHVHNKSLNIALLVERKQASQLQELFAVVQVPAVLDRLVPLPDSAPDRLRFVLLEDVIAAQPGDDSSAASGCWATPSSGSPATATSPSRRTRRRTCSRPSRRTCASGCGATRCGWRSPRPPTSALSRC